ncbi:MAG: phosphoglycerate kinase [Myxococcota bacterium]
MPRLRELAPRGRRVFLRADLNAPLREGAVADDTRLRASRETLEWLRGQGGRVVLASHLGRPQGRRRPELSLRLVAEALGLPLAPDSVGPEVEAQVAELRDGDALLLENLRFHPGETRNAPEFVRALARLCDVYVDDAFGCMHRAHASIVGLARAVPTRAAGALVEREIEALSRVRDRPDSPYLCIVGGAKVSDKLAVLGALCERADVICIGGAMAYTFLAARGEPTGRSKIEPDLIEKARDLARRARELILPCDHIVAPSPEEGARARAVRTIPEDELALDIGPESVAVLESRIRVARTVFWNGPLGLFERAPFDAGTLAVARALAESPAYSVVGGGDSIAALRAAGVADRVDHVSTGGGASLEFLEGRPLPGIEALRFDR